MRGSKDSVSERSFEFPCHNRFINTRNWRMWKEKLLPFLIEKDMDTTQVDILMPNQVLIISLLVTEMGRDSLVLIKPTNRLYYSALESEPRIPF